MEPTSTALYLIASAAWKAIEGTEVLKAAYSGIVGNRADWAFGKIINRLKSGEIVNYDIQRAVSEAYLNATLLACHACLKPLESSQGIFSGNDAYFSDEAKSLRKIKHHLEEQLEKIKDENYVMPVGLAAHNHEELLLIPENSPASSLAASLALQLKEQLLQDFSELFDTESALSLPDSFRKSILDGWYDGKGRQDWFEWVCGFFHEYLKTRPRLSEILEKQWLSKLVLDNQAMSVRVVDIEQALISLSGQVIEIINLLKRLEGKTDELLEYGRLIPIILDILQGRIPPAPTPHKYLNAFAHYDLANLVGRERQLAEIENRFKHHRLLLLRGMGGIGKTTLAKAFISRVTGQYDHVAYVEIVGTISASLLRTLGNSPDVAFTYQPDLSAEENFTALLDVLRHLPNLLLVLDNALDPDDLAKRKQALESLNAAVLLTGRVRLRTFEQAGLVQEISYLEADEAMALFENRAGMPVADADRPTVTTMLDHAYRHPKLIEVLAKAVYANPLLTLAKAQALVAERAFDAQPINVPFEFEGTEPDQPTTTVYRILLGLFDTEPLPDELKQLLRYFAVLPAIDIPVADLVQLLGYDTPEAQQPLLENLRKLAQTGWLDDLHNRYFSIHGLIQWVVLARLQPTTENCAALLAEINGLFYRLFVANPLNTQPYLVYGDELAVRFKVDKSELIATLYGNLSASYGALGQHDKELDYNLKALAIREAVLPTNHPHLARSYNNIAATYGALGQHDKRLDYDLKALAIFEAVLPTKHPDLARSYNNIAFTHYHQGDVSQALDFMHRAVAIWERVLPPAHPNLAQSRKNLAFLEEAAGQ